MRPEKLLAGIACALASLATHAAPDLVVVGADVHTVDPTSPRVSAFAVEAGRFIAVGDDATILALAGPETRVVEGAGRTVTPGFFDGHAHVSGNSRPVAGVDLAYVADKDEWLQRILEADDRLPEGAWITGGGWDHTLSDGAYPTRAMLDSVLPDRPAFLRHIDGHYAWVNSRALELAGVTADTPVPPGGEIVLDEAGEPSGILLEGAAYLVGSIVPDRTDAQRREGLAAMQRYANSLGVTGLHQMGGLEDYLWVVEQGDPTLRIWYGSRLSQSDGEGDAARAAAIVTDRDRIFDRVEATGLEEARGPLLRLGFVKLINDGVLSAHTAVLKAAYDDRPDWSGEYITDPEALAARVRAVAAAGMPVAIHSIGDAAVAASLDAFEGARDLPVPHPHRIEHIEVLAPEDLPRFRALGVVASMQPNHATNAIVYVPVRLGEERSAHAYVWRSLLDDGATLVFGADYGTSPLSPLAQIADAVFRESPFGFNDGEPWHPEQAVSFAEALRAYTQTPADITPWGDEVGSITVGKWADFVMLDGPVPAPMDASFRDLGVASTFFAGREVFAAP
jgi:predicted amidohydrolase YtcJ